MTRTVLLGFAFLVAPLGTACRKTAAHESPTTVPVGVVGIAPITSNGESGGQAKPAKPTSSSCGLRATLREAPVRQMGDHRFAIDLKNESTHAVKLVLPGDGSEVGWRTPIITWKALKNGVAVPQEEGGRCGMMNPLKVEEVFTLGPGETKTIDEWIGYLPYPAGTYEMRVTYKNDPSLAEREGKGKAREDEVAKAFASTSPCEVTSNALSVTIAPLRTP
jgi:hypothetical protein